MALKRILYTSRAADHLTAADVVEMLIDIRAHNIMNGIHGLISFDARGFLQMLEGTPDAIDELMAKITDDRRHHAMVLLLSEQATEPFFVTFYDIVREGQDIVSLNDFPRSATLRLSDEATALIAAGYAAMG
jgi:hypothetical protein